MPNEARLSVLDEILCAALGAGLVLVALWPSARGMSAVGWLPMWLVGMPAVAWWALHGFALPRRASDAARARAAARRQRLPQARRGQRPARRPEARRVA